MTNPSRVSKMEARGCPTACTRPWEWARGGAGIDPELGSGCGVDCEDPGYLKPARTGVWVELASAKAVARCGSGGASGMSPGETGPRPGEVRGRGDGGGEPCSLV